MTGHPLVSAVSLVVWGRNPEKEFAKEAAVYMLNRHKRDFVMLNNVEQICTCNNQGKVENKKVISNYAEKFGHFEATFILSPL